MWYFTADEHYGHTNAIKYCNRPFETREEMDTELISRHNEVVRAGDTVVHAGDFTLANAERAETYIRQLNGSHVFVHGSHDRWLKNGHWIWAKTIEKQHLVVCHYAMHVWPRSHYNSWHVFGHSHGGLDLPGKRWDVGVDNNDYRPVSFKQLKAIMDARADNPNLVKKER
jgi:calcineurin-like phosphoesterase family protein